MAMVQGSASLSGLTIVGSGAALTMASSVASALETSAVAALVALALPGVSTSLPDEAKRAIRQSACDIANGISSIVPYIQSNAVVHIDTSTEAQIVAGSPVDLAVQ